MKLPTVLLLRIYRKRMCAYLRINTFVSTCWTEKNNTAYRKHQDKEVKPVLVADGGLWYAIEEPWNTTFLQELLEAFNCSLGIFWHAEKPVGIKDTLVPTCNGRT